MADFKLTSSPTSVANIFDRPIRLSSKGKGTRSKSLSKKSVTSIDEIAEIIMENSIVKSRNDIKKISPSLIKSILKNDTNSRVNLISYLNLHIPIPQGLDGDIYIKKFAYTYLMMYLAEKTVLAKKSSSRSTRKALSVGGGTLSMMLALICIIALCGSGLWYGTDIARGIFGEKKFDASIDRVIHVVSEEVRETAYDWGYDPDIIPDLTQNKRELLPNHAQSYLAIVEFFLSLIMARTMLLLVRIPIANDEGERNRLWNEYLFLFDGVMRYLDRTIQSDIALNSHLQGQRQASLENSEGHRKLIGYASETGKSAAKVFAVKAKEGYKTLTNFATNAKDDSEQLKKNKECAKKEGQMELIQNKLSILKSRLQTIKYEKQEVGLSEGISEEEQLRRLKELNSAGAKILEEINTLNKSAYSVSEKINELHPAIEATGGGGIIHDSDSKKEKTSPSKKSPSPTAATALPSSRDSSK